VKITSSDIANITQAKLIGPQDLVVTDIVTDSRQLSYSEGLLFIAIRGKNHDGHLFIDNLYQRGIRCFIVEIHPEKPERYSDAAFIITKNSIVALQLLASHRR
jgi:UDP-N-acetylmuramyl pentapeptide synthase